MPLLIAFSRLYLGAHWLSDVLGGLFLAGAWTTFAGLFYLRQPAERDPSPWVALVAALALAISGAWHLRGGHAADLARYAPREPTRTLSLATWLDDGWRALPSWRIDLDGDREQPLTFQWAGSTAALAQRLAADRWSRPRDLNLGGLLTLLDPGAPLASLPVFPRLQEGRREELCLVRSDGGRRLVFRLWPTAYRLGDSDEPLWVGTVEPQAARRLTGVVALPVSQGDYSLSLQTLQRALAAPGRSRSVQRPTVENAAGYLARRSTWDGRILLGWAGGSEASR